MNFTNKFIKVRNINLTNKYYREYSILFFKIKKRNLKKYEFYKNKKYMESLPVYNERMKKLEDLKKYRKDKEYILTCYIIAYNHGSSIRRAIESVLEQETKYNYLIKILDDCSGDETIDVCMEFAEKYPEKIQLIIQPENTEGKHASSIFRTIDTKYFTLLDGDDYWCDSTKIEKGLDFLENNSEYVMWGHDTLWLNPIKEISRSYIHEDQKIEKLNNPVTFENYAYIALSARICRNIIDFKKEYELNHKRDIFIYYAMLDKGPLYYHDEIMSVYVFNGKGVFSSLRQIERYYSRIYSLYTINKYLNYRHDNYFTSAVNSKRLVFCKKIFGMKAGWFIYVQFKKQKFLKKLFKEKIEKFKKIEKGHDLFSNEELKILKNLAEKQK